MILIISHQKDTHATIVLKKLHDMGVAAAILDLAKFPRFSQLKIEYSKNEAIDTCFGWDGMPGFDLRQCQSIWWRRPQPFELHKDLTKSSHRTFALGEIHESMKGLWYMLDAFWINNPARDELAHRKVYQLKMAQQIGLTIPDTCITNDPDAAQAFIDKKGVNRTIYKAFSATWEEWRETRLVKEGELGLLQNVKYAPVIFQEYVDAVYDLRITVVGDKIFPAAIYSQETAYKVDMRMDIGAARIEAVELPPEINAMLLRYMKELGLVYGAIDMRLQPDGTYVFLEINPVGQWLFIEEATGQPIAQEMANVLCKGGIKHQEKIMADHLEAI